MQATLNLDQFCDLSKVTPELAGLVDYKVILGEQVAYYPQGTVFSGDMALFLCRTGQATPSDKEAMQALGLTEEQIADLKVSYEMTSKGIHDKDARELYRAGVILGYDKDKREIPGPNWAKYHAAKSAVEDEE